VLFGDSNAGQFTEPSARAANRAGFDLTVATFSACPFADMTMEWFGDVASWCEFNRARSLAQVVRNRPNLVILASSSTLYIGDDKYRLTDVETGVVGTSAEGRARVYEAGLERVLRVLDRAGIPSLVVHVIPHLDGLDPQGCPAVRMYLDAQDCGVTISRRDIAEQRRLALAAETGAIAAVPGASGVDFAGQLCGPRGCPARRHGIWVYRDETHLSVPGALTLTDRFAKAITARARPPR
jgi:hypothetical protein